MLRQPSLTQPRIEMDGVASKALNLMPQVRYKEVNPVTSMKILHMKDNSCDLVSQKNNAGPTVDLCFPTGESESSTAIL